MSEVKNRKPAFHVYYTDDDYFEVKDKLPDIIRLAERKASEVLEPTVFEKRDVMEIIKDYIRKNNRKVYGGTALNETLKIKNPDDAIYDDYIFSDIEFYSPTPVVDLVEICNNLYRKGYKFVQGKEAQHEETYSIYANFQLYCDITYAPTRVYYGIKTIEIDGISYVDPHFMLIDYLRMINQPLTASGQRWEKAFERMYRLLKNYPIESFDKTIDIPNPPEEIRSYITRIKTEFLKDRDVQESFLISGFDAYNFFIRHASNDKNVENMARIARNKNTFDIKNLKVNVPYMELISVRYKEDVEKLYNFIRLIVKEPSKVSIDEYFPLFQFTGYSVTINYDNHPIAKIYEGDGYCIPDIRTNVGYKYVSFQYLLMILYINKFRAHLDKNKLMYFNYGLAVSNLIKARNVFLEQNSLSVINDTVFGEFRISCTGNTISFSRMSRLRLIERKKNKQNKRTQFVYTPEEFFKKDPESQTKFDPSKAQFNNTAGNKITNPKNLLFRIDANGDISEEINTEEIFDTELTSEVNSETDALISPISETLSNDTITVV
ncbi:poxvirus poly(A) polymerase catalytic subunit-like protein [Cotonvirus japonicus]|uniref:Putative poly(A) polymerase catalytic subunit n=1 Tax=Cotonvirus japonicus TaxID=2811091 RepID=A0ABM7NSX4_9VIRU|nr:poxvirus poly(A) polymerase catalytic subunit-like protein [Cotonvirus japonicus]BCS83239.1 poxvirus poly(A) polymerase catalytic subunit-like protein [Cotonvirus japonicus]